MPIRFLFVLLFIAFAQLTVQAKTFTLTVHDEAEKPIPHAKFYYYASPKPKDWNTTRIDTQTDDNGQSVISLDADSPLKKFVVKVETPGYTPYYANWDNPDTDPVPDAYTITVQKAVTVGGVVVDPEGNTLAGAEVNFSWTYDTNQIRAWHNISNFNRGKTDAHGLWKYESLPPNLLNISRRIEITHKDFSLFEQEMPLSSLLIQDDGSFKTTFRLEKGITVKGRVTDTSGKPIADAIVVGRNVYRNGTGKTTTTKTDAEGNYMLQNWLPSRDASIGIWKAEMMTALENLPPFDKKNPPNVNFTLKPAGKPITVKIVDKAGNPIQGGYIVVKEWKGKRIPSTLLLTGTDSRPRTDAEGRWAWKEAPEEGIVFDMFFSEHMSVRDKSVSPRDEEYVFTSGEPLSITGNVTDAETGKAVPVFNVLWGRIFPNRNEMYWSPRNGAGSNGKYNVRTNTPTQEPVGVKIEAAGYESAVSRKIDSGEGRITIDFALKKLPVDKFGIHGVVVLPDGKPAAKATIAMATFRNFSFIGTGGKVQSYGERQPVVTNEVGQFNFPYIDFVADAKGRYIPQPGMEKTDFILLVCHDAGFKYITQQDWNALGEKKTVTLESWGRIEGTVKQGTLPGKLLPVRCSISFRDDKVPRRIEPFFFADYDTITDELGKFVFDRVPPALVSVGRTITYNDRGDGSTQTTSHSTDRFALPPGETQTVMIGGIGRPVTGKLVPSDQFETPPDWRFAHIECGQRYRANQKRQRVCAVTEDGTFRLDDIFEGDWQLTVYLDAPQPNEDSSGTRERIGELKHNFTVGTIPNGVSDEPKDLGSLTVKKLIPSKPLRPQIEAEN